MKKNKMNIDDYMFSFPAIRGIQAQREYYSTMCPLHIVERLFKFDDDDLPADLRAQRTLNRSRVPEIAKYIAENPTSYIFSSLTASISGEVYFEPIGDNEIDAKLGSLHVPADAKFLINDGQHRRAAIEHALKENPALKYETISVVFFVDAGLKNSQQMFADLNRYAVRTTRSLGILYDHRDPLSKLVRDLADEVTVFNGMTEMAKTTISNRSRKLFTLSSIYEATKKLLGKSKGTAVTDEERQIAISFWNEVSKSIPDWMDAKKKIVAPSELRADFIHAHGIALQAIAIAGSFLLSEKPTAWKRPLSKLRQIDWARKNSKLWEGRAMVGGKLNKAQNHVLLTSNAIKKYLNLELTPQEHELERKYRKKG